MLANLSMAVLDKERVVTTVAKAKAVRSAVDRLITFSKRGGLNSIRIAAKTVTDKDILHKLFSDIGPSYKTREGGYTRILKLGQRWGDNAQTCILELTGRNSGETARKRKKKRKADGETPEAPSAGRQKQAADEAPETEAAGEKPVTAKPEKKKAKPKAAAKKKSVPEQNETSEDKK